MVLILKKIRKKLAKDYEPIKYIRYAVGEILLVVVGILIAVQINNWNESRKQKQKLNTILQVVKENLASNLVEIDTFMKVFNGDINKSFEIYLTKEFTIENYKTAPFNCMIEGYDDFIINQQGFNLLKNHTTIKSASGQQIALEISEFYNNHLIEVTVGNKELGIRYMENLKNMENFDWFSTYVLDHKLDEFVDYISSNPNAKNRILVYFLLFREYVNELTLFNREAKKLILEIDMYLKEN